MANNDHKDIEEVVEEEEDDEEEEDTVFITVPISVTVLLLVVYILLGAATFRAWETQWSMVDATYFCYITLSTIGFGDLVPGNGRYNKVETTYELLIGAVYSLFGLALLSMCLNLIQDEISAKFSWLASKLGLSEKEEETETEDCCESEIEFDNPSAIKVCDQKSSNI